MNWNTADLEKLTDSDHHLGTDADGNDHYTARTRAGDHQTWVVADGAVVFEQTVGDLGDYVKHVESTAEWDSCTYSEQPLGEFLADVVESASKSEDDPNAGKELATDGGTDTTEDDDCTDLACEVTALFLTGAGSTVRITTADGTVSGRVKKTTCPTGSVVRYVVDVRLDDDASPHTHARLEACDGPEGVCDATVGLAECHPDDAESFDRPDLTGLLWRAPDSDRELVTDGGHPRQQCRHCRATSPAGYELPREPCPEGPIFDPSHEWVDPDDVADTMMADGGVDVRPDFDARSVVVIDGVEQVVPRDEAADLARVAGGEVVEE